MLDAVLDAVLASALLAGEVCKEDLGRAVGSARSWAGELVCSCTAAHLQARDKCTSWL